MQARGTVAYFDSLRGKIENIMIFSGDTMLVDCQNFEIRTHV